MTGQLKRGKSAVIGASGVERAGGQPEACCACPGQGSSSGCRWRGDLSRRPWCELRATCCIGSLRPATRRGRTPRSSTARLGQLSESAATSGLCDRAGLPGAGRLRPTTGAGAERDGHCASRGRVTVSSRRTRGRLLRQDLRALAWASGGRRAASVTGRETAGVRHSRAGICSAACGSALDWRVMRGVRKFGGWTRHRVRTSFGLRRNC